MSNIENAITQLNQQQIPKSIEFTVQDDFERNLPAILSNLDDVEKWAIANTEVDRNLVLATDEDFEKAKKRCAELNKVAKAINDKKIDVKKAYIKPFDIFDKRTKEVIAVILSARENLWGQVTQAEEQKRKEKEQKLRAYWQTINADGEILTYDQIANTKWLNKSTSFATAFAEMDERLKAIKTDIEAIRNLHSEFEVSLIERYREGHTLGDIIGYNSRLNAQKQVVTPCKIESQPLAQDEPKNEIKPNNGLDEPTVEIVFKVAATPTQFDKLKQFLNANGIKYSKV